MWILLLLTLAACVHDGSKRSDGTAEDSDSAYETGGDTGPPCTDTSLEEQQLYDEIWATLDRLYPYFDYKGIDWAGLGEQCRSYVCDDNVSYHRLVTKAMDCLLGPLSDGHIGIVDKLGVGRHYGWELAPPNIDTDIVERRLDPGVGEIGAYSRTGTLDGGRFGYIRVDTWSDAALTHDQVYALTAEMPTDIQGMVIDSRYNLGGHQDRAETLAAWYVPRADAEHTPYGYWQVRDETDDDASTHELGHKNKLFIGTAGFDGITMFEGPVAVLIGPDCMSACESFVSMMTSLAPTARTFGATTAGADSYRLIWRLIDGETDLYYSWGAIYQADKTTLTEWNGFPPEVPVEFAGGEEDQVLEAGVEWLTAESPP